MCRVFTTIMAFCWLTSDSAKILRHRSCPKELVDFYKVLRMWPLQEHSPVAGICDQPSYTNCKATDCSETLVTAFGGRKARIELTTAYQTFQKATK